MTGKCCPDLRKRGGGMAKKIKAATLAAKGVPPKVIKKITGK